MGRRRSSVDCSFDHFRRRPLRVEENGRSLQLGNMTALADDMYPGECTTNSPVEDINTRCY